MDPALVHHYFGSKEQVFVAAMQLPLDPAQELPLLLAGPRDEVGERTVRLFLSIWSNAATRAPLLGMLRSAMTHESAAALLRQFVTRAWLSRLAEAVDAPDRELRVEAAAAQLVGLGLLRFVVRVEPLASASDDAVVAIIAPTIQRYLDPRAGA